MHERSTRDRGRARCACLQATHLPLWPESLAVLRTRMRRGAVLALVSASPAAAVAFGKLMYGTMMLAAPPGAPEHTRDSWHTQAFRDSWLFVVHPAAAQARGDAYASERREASAGAEPV